MMIETQTPNGMDKHEVEESGHVWKFGINHSIIVSLPIFRDIYPNPAAAFFISNFL